MRSKDFKQAVREARKQRVNNIDRHVFMCTGPDCVSKSEGKDAWSYLKKRISRASRECPGGIYRSRTECLDICEAGPIGIVYPEGTWYAGLNRDGIDRVVEQHLLGGEIVEDMVIARERLKPQKSGREPLDTGTMVGN